jgi:hypothetical protein
MPEKDPGAEKTPEPEPDAPNGEPVDPLAPAPR